MIDMLAIPTRTAWKDPECIFGCSLDLSPFNRMEIIDLMCSVEQYSL